MFRLFLSDMALMKYDLSFYSKVISALALGLFVTGVAGMARSSLAHAESSAVQQSTSLDEASLEYVTVSTSQSAPVYGRSSYNVDIFVNDVLSKEVHSERHWENQSLKIGSNSAMRNARVLGLETTTATLRPEEFQRNHILLIINRMIVKVPSRYSDLESAKPYFKEQGWAYSETMREKNTYLVTGDFVDVPSALADIDENYDGDRGEELEHIYKIFAGKVAIAARKIMAETDVVYALPASSVRHEQVDLSHYPNFVSRFDGRDPFVNLWSDDDYAARLLMGTEKFADPKNVFLANLEGAKPEEIETLMVSYNFNLPNPNSPVISPSTLSFVSPQMSSTADVQFSVGD